MTTTQNLHLPQFEATDRIMRTDFNDAFAALDAGVPRIATGSYIGTSGNYGSSNPKSIHFPFTPKLVIIIDSTKNTAPTIFFGSNGTAPCYDSPCSGAFLNYTIENETLTWYGNGVPFSQYGVGGTEVTSIEKELNFPNRAYPYIAIG